MILKKIILRFCPSFLRPYYTNLENSPLSMRFARGVFWSISGTLISRGLMLCATILVARIIGKVNYGELGMIQTTIGMFGVFAGFGLGLTATKYVAEFRSSDPKRAGRIISLSWLIAMMIGGLMATVLFFIAPWLADRTINAPHLVGVLRIGALILLFSALNGAQTGALSGFEAFKTIARVNLLVGLISFPILVVGAYWGGLTGAVWALVINLAFNWLLNYLALRKEAIRNEVIVAFRSCFEELPILWKFSLPAVLASSMVGPVNWVCSAILVNQPDGYSEMGIYNAANQWFNVLIFIPSMVGSVILPILSNQLGQNEASESIKTMLLSVKVNLIIVLPLAIIVSIASPFIMGLYGEGFQNGWPTMIVVLFTAVILSILSPVGNIIAASGRMWIGFSMNLGWAITYVVATYLMMGLGSFGLASARGIAYTVHTIWTFGFAYKMINKQRGIS